MVRKQLDVNNQFTRGDATVNSAADGKPVNAGRHADAEIDAAHLQEGGGRHMPIRSSAFKRAARLRLRPPRVSAEVTDCSAENIDEKSQGPSRWRRSFNWVLAPVRMLADPVLWVIWSCLIVVLVCAASFVYPIFLSDGRLSDEAITQQDRAYASSIVGQKSPIAFVWIDVQSLDATRHTARCNVGVVLEDRATIPVLTDRNTSIFDDPASFDGKTMTLQLSSQNGWQQSIELPFTKNGYSTSGQTVDIPAAASPTRFPQDEWRLDVSGFVGVPYGYALLDPDSPDEWWDFAVPVLITIIQSPQLEQWELSTTRSISDALPTTRTPPNSPVSYPPHAVPEALAMGTMTRSFDVWLFAYAIAALPMILGAGYLFKRRHAGDGAAALSLAATLLSLLALRQVVTPVDIQGLTRLDRLLGLELAVLIAAFTLTTVFVESKTE